MNPPSGDPFHFCYGTLKSANSVGKINTADSLQKNWKQLLAEEKGLHHLGQVVIGLYIYTYAFIFQMAQRGREV